MYVMRQWKRSMARQRICIDDMTEWAELRSIYSSIKTDISGTMFPSKPQRQLSRRTVDDDDVT